MKHILKKDLPFTKKGERVVKHNNLWCIEIPSGFWFIGKTDWDMTEWIEEVEEGLDMFPVSYKARPENTLKEYFSKIYYDYRVRGYQGKFMGHDIMVLPNDDLYFIIAYLDDFIKSTEKNIGRLDYYTKGNARNESGKVEEKPKGARLFCRTNEVLGNIFDEDQTAHYREYALNTDFFNVRIGKDDRSTATLLFIIGYLAEHLEFIKK